MWPWPTTHLLWCTNMFTYTCVSCTNVNSSSWPWEYRDLNMLRLLLPKYISNTSIKTDECFESDYTHPESSSEVLNFLPLDNKVQAAP